MNEEANDEQGLVKVNEAAVLLRVSARTVWRMISDQQLQKVMVRGATRVRRADVLAHIGGRHPQTVAGRA
jgi:excisionase family DNA binding protein